MRSACAPQVAGSIVFKLLRSWNVGEEEAPNIDVARLHVYGTAVPGLVELIKKPVLVHSNGLAPAPPLDQPPLILPFVERAARLRDRPKIVALIAVRLGVPIVRRRAGGLGVVRVAEAKDAHL